MRHTSWCATMRFFRNHHARPAVGGALRDGVPRSALELVLEGHYGESRIARSRPVPRCFRLAPSANKRPSKSKLLELGRWSQSMTISRATKRTRGVPMCVASVIFDHSGQFDLHIVSANRPKPTGNPFPQNPTGPAVGYFGSYAIDEATKTVTFHIDRSTFPRLGRNRSEENCHREWRRNVV